MTAHGIQEDVNEGDDEVVANGSSIEVVDNLPMEGSSTINPVVSDHKDVNLHCEDSKAEGTKIKPLESKVENVNGNTEDIESNESGALY